MVPYVVSGCARDTWTSGKNGIANVIDWGTKERERERDNKIIYTWMAIVKLWVCVFFVCFNCYCWGVGSHGHKNVVLDAAGGMSGASWDRCRVVVSENPPRARRPGRRGRSWGRPGNKLCSCLLYSWISRGGKSLPLSHFLFSLSLSFSLHSFPTLHVLQLSRYSMWCLGQWLGRGGSEAEGRIQWVVQEGVIREQRRRRSQRRLRHRRRRWNLYRRRRWNRRRWWFSTRRRERENRREGERERESLVEEDEEGGLLTLARRIYEAREREEAVWGVVRSKGVGSVVVALVGGGGPRRAPPVDAADWTTPFLTGTLGHLPSRFSFPPRPFLRPPSLSLPPPARSSYSTSSLLFFLSTSYFSFSSALSSAPPPLWSCSLHSHVSIAKSSHLPTFFYF